MTVLKELCVAQRKYQDKQGSDKTVWLKIGEIHTSNEGREYMVIYPHINFASLPRKEGEDRVFVSMFEPKPRDQRNAAADQVKAASSSSSFNDDIPW